MLFLGRALGCVILLHPFGYMPIHHAWSSQFFLKLGRQEKRRRRVMKQAGKLSADDLAWLLALKASRDQRRD